MLSDAVAAVPNALDWRQHLPSLRLPGGLGLPPSDLGLTVASAVLTCVEAGLPLTYGARPAYLALVAIHLLVTVAQPLRHACPRTSMVLTYTGLVLYALLCMISPVRLGLSPVILTAATSLYAVTRWVADLRWATVALMTALVGSVLNPVLLANLDHPALARHLAFPLILALVCIICLVTTYLYARAWRSRALALQASAAQAAIDAVSAERLALARELHDVVGHALTTVRVQAATALAVGDPPTALAALETIRDTTDTSLASVREVVSLLRDGEAHGSGSATSPLADLTTIPALTDAARISPDSDVPDRQVLTTWNHQWSLMQRLTLLRTLTEALTNAARHGSGSARVSLETTKAVCHLVVTNPVASHHGTSRTAPGAPQTGSGQGGTGLIGLAERARMVGATFAASRTTGSDGEPLFAIELSLPVAQGAG